MLTQVTVRLGLALLCISLAGSSLFLHAQPVQTHSQTRYLQDVDTVDITSDMHVTVVFFAYLYEERPWQDLLKQYATYILETGVLERANRVFICMSTNTNNDWMTNFQSKAPASQHAEGIQRLHEGMELFDQYFGKYADKLLYDFTLGNVFEFPGIVKVWENARTHQDDEMAHKSVTLYFHSKGMWGHGHEIFKEGNMLREVGGHLGHVVEPWEEIIALFAKKPKLMWGGIGCTQMGGSLQNYFWARDSYLRTRMRPIRAMSRYYYEHWLGMVDTEQVFPFNTTLRYDYVYFIDGAQEHDVESWSGEPHNSTRILPPGQYQNIDVPRNKCDSTSYIKFEPKSDRDFWMKVLE